MGVCTVQRESRTMRYRAGQSNVVQWPPIYHQQIGGNGCTCEDDNAHDEYEWQSPFLHPSFDPVETCTTLGNRTALFIGDSTMAQTASTLMNSLLPGKCQAQNTIRPLRHSCWEVFWSSQ